jgi:hypothetical protein
MLSSIQLTNSLWEVKTEDWNISFLWDVCNFAPGYAASHPVRTGLDGDYPHRPLTLCLLARSNSEEQMIRWAAWAVLQVNSSITHQEIKSWHWKSTCLLKCLNITRTRGSLTERRSTLSPTEWIIKLFLTTYQHKSRIYVQQSGRHVAHNMQFAWTAAARPKASMSSPVWTLGTGREGL